MQNYISASCKIPSTTEYTVQLIEPIAGAGWTAGGPEELLARRLGHPNVAFRIRGKQKRKNNAVDIEFVQLFRIR